MILTIIISIAMDTLPVQPIKTLLPRPVKSEKLKVDESKNHKAGNANNGGRRIAPISLANR